MDICKKTKYEEKLKNASPKEIIKTAMEEWGDSLTFASSLGAEDQVITHILCQLTDDPDIFIIDTGRLHPQTYALIDKTREYYNISLKIYFPDYSMLQGFYNKNGVNSFYKSVEMRKACCLIRKVEPLSRALAGKKAWITGLRREQSSDRKSISIIEWDELHSIYKINPLANMSTKDLWLYIKENNIPYNPLHDRGYASIGCEPCTRAIVEGESPRAGRWWWEDGKKECGLHTERLGGDNGQAAETGI
ncbi:phosphoadenylyl-sulfate reductase [Spirochaetia bacterium 38H-sp]|uniref:Adenosine 5'-phosphosulfate reductase n=1 Tax=Rarispira pelagica TaxID=3141764 RepID=A0ABU9U9T0_9SPIR